MALALNGSLVLSRASCTSSPLSSPAPQRQQSARYVASGGMSLSCSSFLRTTHGLRCSPHQLPRRERRFFCSASTYTVELEHAGVVRTLQVPEDETILSVALDEGMDLPYDCKLGVCMTCPAKLVEGQVDQSEGMLSDDVQEKGYTLLCASYARSNCKIRIIPEEELLSLQLATAND
eukprot:TRINITY_DN23103_c0_g1_i1.p1 TRINITY_DN23103_c0_g1~~TRINITY_DN23103_c0_g1_i1.p1  ORF type:complete len:177 (-),score=14.81 TRINITY_DN23103_c0_g1_i1:510-1040(-)